MNWLEKTSQNTTQYILPFQEPGLGQDLMTMQKHPDVDGLYRCALCSRVMNDLEVHDAAYWLDEDENEDHFGVEVIAPAQSGGVPEKAIQDAMYCAQRTILNALSGKKQEMLRATLEPVPENSVDEPAMLSQLGYNEEHNLKWEIEKCFQSIFPSANYLTVTHHIGNSNNIKFYIDYFSSDKCFQDISQLYIKKNSGNIWQEKPVCPECSDLYVKKCSSCDNYAVKGSIEYDNYADIGGDDFCDNCYTTCGGCNEAILHDDSYSNENDDNVYCESCFESRREGDVESIWENFYSEFPNFEKSQVLEKARDEDPMPAKYYVAIFEGLPWNHAYGGERWAEIARTWIQLQKLSKLFVPGNYDKITSQVLNEAIITVDHCFDLAHNTGSLFTKAPEHIKTWLMKALNEKRDSGPEGWLGKASRHVRQLIKQHHPYEYYSRTKGERPADSGPDPNAYYEHYVVEQQKESRQRKAKQMVEQLIENGTVYGGEFDSLISSGKLKKEDFRDTPFYEVFDLFRKCGDHGYYIIKAFAYGQSPSPKRLVDAFVYSVDQTLQDLGPDLFQMYIDYLRPKIRPEDLEAVADKEFLYNLPLGYAETLSAWVEVLKSGKLPEKQESQIAAFISGRRLLKLAELNQQSFYDFYGLTVVNCDNFPTYERTKCMYLKIGVVGQAIQDLLPIISRAVVREARHVNNSGAMQG